VTAAVHGLLGTAFNRISPMNHLFIGNPSFRRKPESMEFQ